VLDTNVVLDWLIFDDPETRAIRREIESERACVVTREDCRAELLRILGRPKLRATAQQRSSALLQYDHFVEPLSARPLSRALPQCRDHDDQKFLELADQSGAQWLISKDKLVLKLAAQTVRLGLFRILHPREASAVLLGDSAKT
jgi:putative PIN family toxin of toxin-antitoxin system